MRLMLKAVGVLAVAVAGLAACADDSGSGDEAAVIESYCAGVAETEARGEELFAGVDENDEEALDEAERAMLAFVRANYPQGDEVPEELREDERAFLAGFERRVEEGVEPTAEQQAAEERLLAWQEDHCSG